MEWGAIFYRFFHDDRSDDRKGWHVGIEQSTRYRSSFQKATKLEGRTIVAVPFHNAQAMLPCAVGCLGTGKPAHRLTIEELSVEEHAQEAAA